MFMVLLIKFNLEKYGQYSNLTKNRIFVRFEKSLNMFIAHLVDEILNIHQKAIFYIR